ncbi:MAG: hypothetical protein WB424_15440 [Terracidiphilus sp.]|jgi:hypothetical protein
MATQAQPRFQTIRSSKLRTAPAKSVEEDFLAGVMVSVSASLDSMSEEEREVAVAAAEDAVAHLQ